MREDKPQIGKGARAAAPKEMTNWLRKIEFTQRSRSE